MPSASYSKDGSALSSVKVMDLIRMSLGGNRHVFPEIVFAIAG